MRKLILFGFLLFILIINSINCLPVTEKKPALLIISYDGFRNEYFQRNVTPTMNKLRADGTSTDYMTNVFSTKTFPNHHSIVTGLYAENHGVMANSFFDSKLGYLGYGYDLYHYNEKILPIWILNEMAGPKRYSGCMWPGCDYTYDGKSPTFYEKWNKSVPFEERVDQALGWFNHPKTPTNLVLFYIEDPDSLAHIYGPESNMITEMIHKLDNLSKYIQDKLKKLNLSSHVNVVHLSDHGMDSVSPPNFIDLTKFVQNGTVDFYGTSPVIQIVPKTPAQETDVYNRLKTAAKSNKHFKIYKLNELPERWHYNNKRIGPIVAVADVGYAFQDLIKSAKWYQDTYNITITPTTKYGVHGYDNTAPSMHPFFFSYGPLIKEKHTVKPFNTVDLYSLFCEILQITPQPNNGSLSNVADILKTSSGISTQTKSVAIVTLGSLMVFFSLLMFISALTVYIVRFRRRIVILEEKDVGEEENEILLDGSYVLLNDVSDDENI